MARWVSGRGRMWKGGWGDVVGDEIEPPPPNAGNLQPKISQRPQQNPWFLEDFNIIPYPKRSPQ